VAGLHCRHLWPLVVSVYACIVYMCAVLNKVPLSTCFHTVRTYPGLHGRVRVCFCQAWRRQELGLRQDMYC
jgi:hypothetical protein